MLEKHKEDPTVQAFIDEYGLDAKMMVGTEDNPVETTIGRAQVREAIACTAKDEVRNDPDRRMRFYAGRLAAAGTPIKPKHQHLLEPPSE